MYNHFKFRISVFTFTLLIIFSCSKNDVTVCDDKNSLYLHSDFPIGVAIDYNKFSNNTAYKTIADQQFNSFTPENIFKAENLHPSEYQFNWLEADALTDFCLNNHKRIHGHTLIWHDQLPDWIKTYNGSADEWEKLFKNHIQSIVLHFKGKVSAWDVVNEAFNEDGTLRNSIWKQKIGNNYIEKAFIHAHEADPNALLFYNDYNLESNPTKRNSVIRYLNNLRSRGVKIDGIGLQMHIGISYPEPSAIAESIKNVSDNNYKVHISELDISVNMLGKDINPSPALFDQQANYLGKIVVNYKQIPAKNQYGITFWGISDNDSWIPSYFSRKDYPLLYDNNYIPKPAYCKLFELL